MSKAAMTALPYPSAFKPTSITGCSLWLDAADATTITGTTSITAWRDKSGNNNNPTFSGTNPSYVAASNAVISANGNQNFTVPEATLATSTGSGSLFFVYGDQQTQSSYSALFGTSTPFDYLFQCLLRPDGNNYQYNNISPDSTLKAVFNTTSTLLYNMNYTYGTTTGSLRLNGTNYVSSYIWSVVPSGDLSLSSTGFGNVANVRLYEVIIYKGATALTIAQCQQVEGYLAWKWGLQANLPGSHPYAAAAPITSNALGISRAPAVAAIVPIPKQAMTALSYYASITPVTAATGIQLWLDASDTATTTVVTGKLTAWTDKSGKGCVVTVPATTVTYTSAFLNGRATLGFAGNANITTTIPTPPGNGDYAVIAVWKPYSGGTYAAITMGPTSASPSLGLGYNGSYYNLFEWGQAESDYTAAAGSYVIQIGTRVGGVKTCYINGTAAPTGTGTLQNITNGSVSIGGGDGFYITGEIAEVIIYTGTLTMSQRQVLEGYLAWKWGLQASLPTFVPTSLTNCQIWLDASDSSTITMNGSTVASWRDKTGNGFNVSQSTTASQPTLGTNALVFNGSASLQYSGSVGIFGNSYTTYVVHTPTNTADYRQGIISIKDSTTGFDFEIGQFYIWVSGGSIYNQFSSSLNSITMLGITSTTSLGLNYSINGQPFTGGGAGWTSVSSGSSLLIGNSQYSGVGFIGTLNEYLLFTRSLTTTEHNQVTGYLAWKWGLQASLPTNHPNYSSSPLHPYAAAAPTGAFLRAPAVAALVPTPTLALTAIKKPIASLTLTNSGSTDSYIASYLSNGYVNSIARQAGTGADVGNGIATDTNGNIIITGYYSSNPFTLYTTAGSAFSTTLVNSGQTAFVAQYSSSGAVNWVARFSGSSVGLFCKTDSSNNIYVFGYFTSAPLTAYSSSGTAFGTTISTLYYFLVKYNSSGIIQWIANIGGTGQTSQNSLTCDTNGNVIVTCTGGGITPLNSDGTSYTGSGILGAYRVNGFIVYYNTSGTIQWVASFAGGSRFWNQAISVDSSGNVYCSGYSLGGFAQPYNASGTGMFTVAGASGQNGYIVKYTSAGSNVSGTAYGGSGVTAAPLSQVTDSNANTTIVGTFTGTTFIAYSNNSTSQPFSNTLSNPGTTCGFIVKYNSSFVVQWTANIQAATGVATPTGVTCDSLNNIYVSVYTTGNVTIYNSNGSAATTITNTGTNTSFIVKFSSAGLFIWVARQSGGASTSQYLYGIVTDSIGNPYTVGAYTSAAGFVYSTGF